MSCCLGPGVPHQLATGGKHRQPLHQGRALEHPSRIEAGKGGVSWHWLKSSSRRSQGVNPPPTCRWKASELSTASPWYHRNGNQLHFHDPGSKHKRVAPCWPGHFIILKVNPQVVGSGKGLLVSHMFTSPGKCQTRGPASIYQF